MEFSEELQAQLNKWNSEQQFLKEKLIVIDSDEIQSKDIESIRFVGGVDISYPKDLEDKVHACAAIVIVKLPELEIVYQNYTFVHLTFPYVPEYLAFKEAKFLVHELEILKKRNPDVFPEILLVDGNGILHPRGFGVACHIGVLADIPTVGVAKQLFHVDGLEKNEKHSEKIVTELVNAGDSFPLIGHSKSILGKAVKSTQGTTKPLYISVGHNISLDNAVQIVKKCCRYRIPEPVRQADMISRKFMSENYKKLLKECEIDWQSISKKFQKIEELAQKLKLQALDDILEDKNA